MRNLALMQLLLIAACSESFAPASAVTEFRIVAAKVSLPAQPERANPSPGDTVQVWYEITSTGSITTDLTLSFSGYNLNGEDAGNLRLWRYTGTDWQEHIGTVNIDDSVTVLGISQFSDWTIADSIGGIQPPVPEMVTIVMISFGVLILGGFIWYRRREIAAGIASLFV